MPPNRKWQLKLPPTGLVVVVAAIAIAFVLQSGPPQTPAVETKAQKLNRGCEDVAYAYLKFLRDGQTVYAAASWKPGVRPRTLFDVHGFRPVGGEVIAGVGDLVHADGRPYRPRRVYAEYEVESSTEAGFPIRRRWDIVLEPGVKSVGDLASPSAPVCAIIALLPAQ